MEIQAMRQVYAEFLRVSGQDLVKKLESINKLVLLTGSTGTLLFLLLLGQYELTHTRSETESFQNALTKLITLDELDEKNGNDSEAVTQLDVEALTQIIQGIEKLKQDYTVTGSIRVKRYLQYESLGMDTERQDTDEVDIQDTNFTVEAKQHIIRRILELQSQRGWQETAVNVLVHQVEIDGKLYDVSFYLSLEANSGNTEANLYYALGIYTATGKVPLSGYMFNNTFNKVAGKSWHIVSAEPPILDYLPFNGDNFGSLRIYPLNDPQKIAYEKYAKIFDVVLPPSTFMR